MRCPFCGFELPDNAQFCPSCGKSQTENASTLMANNKSISAQVERERNIAAFTQDEKRHFEKEIKCTKDNEYIYGIMLGKIDSNIYKTFHTVSIVKPKITGYDIPKQNESNFNIDTRAGLWYSNYVVINNSIIEAPKWIRQCSYINIVDTKINGSETLWYSKDITIKNCSFDGDYLLLNSKNIFVDNLNLKGKYSFQRCKHLRIYNSYLDTKDAFWDCEDVIVVDSYVKGEYLAWNTKNITFINCTIESLQGLCYINGLKLVNCKFTPLTTLCFEYCKKINAVVNSPIESIINPISGLIKCFDCKEITLDDKLINPKKTKIILGEK